MNHSFNVDVAAQYGIPCAVILEYFRFWITRNEADGRNFYEGSFWTYGSLKELSDRFPYLTEKQVRKALGRLKSDGIIITGNFNKRAFDRTLWYTITDKGKCLFNADEPHLPLEANGYAPQGEWMCPAGQMEMPLEANGYAPQGAPIPVINTTVNNSFTYPVIGVEEGDARARQPDPCWQSFMTEYKKNIGPLPTSAVECEDLTMFFEEFGADVLREVIHYTARKHPDNPYVYFAYLCRSLLGKGIRTAQQAKAAFEEHERQKGGTDRGIIRGADSASPRRVGNETIL